MKILIDESKNFYKANLHCHTTRSDGRATPERIKEEYMKRGYSAVAFTDHDHLLNVSHLTDESFIAITGCELGISIPKAERDAGALNKIAHLGFLSKDPNCDVTPCYHDKYDWYKFEDLRHLVKYDEPYERVYSHAGINDMVRIGHERGFLVSLNHPNWSLQNAEDYLGYEGFDFVEVHNTGTSITGWYEDEAAYDHMMKAGMSIFPVATDDNHNIHGFEGPRSDSFGGWVMIAADRLGYKELMDSLEAGDFYASTGPEIRSILIDDEGVLRIKTSEAKRIVLLNQGRRVAKVISDDGAPITDVSFKFSIHDRRFRIRVDGFDGGNAYTRIFDVPDDAARFDAQPKA